MWPFTKKISNTAPSIRQQLMVLKSVTLPEVQPDWKLFAKKNKLWDIQTAILEGYNASAAVYTCVEKRATLTSSVPWYAGRKLNDGTVERLPDNHPLNKLINAPNPDFSWMETIHECSQSLDLAGNGYLPIIRAGTRDEPYQLWVLPAQFMKVKPGREQLVDYYEYQDASGNKKVVESNDMIHLRLPNPNDPIFGMPVLMAAGRATDIDRESGNWQKASLQNRNAADLHVEVPAELQPDQVQKVREQLTERYNGPDNARSPIVSSGKINHLSRTAVEMDFVNSRKAVWAEICAVFGMSMADLGFTESVNLANAESMQKALWVNTIIPRLELLKRQFNMQLASDFGDDICLEYDLSGVEALQENLGELLDNANKLYLMGFSAKAINDRLKLGFDDDQLPEEFEPDLPTDDDEPSDEVKMLLKSVGYGNA